MNEQQLIKKDSSSGYSGIFTATSLQGVRDNGRALAQIPDRF